MTDEEKVKLALSFKEGLCESHASLECSPRAPLTGHVRILPESRLPGNEVEYLTQCLPCYEVSAEARQRKMKHYGVMA